MKLRCLFHFLWSLVINFKFSSDRSLFETFLQFSRILAETGSRSGCRKFENRIRIHAKTPDPTGSGSATLVTGVFCPMYTASQRRILSYWYLYLCQSDDECLRGCQHQKLPRVQVLNLQLSAHLSICPFIYHLSIYISIFQPYTYISKSYLYSVYLSNILIHKCLYLTITYLSISL